MGGGKPLTLNLLPDLVSGGTNNVATRDIIVIHHLRPSQNLGVPSREILILFSLDTDLNGSVSVGGSRGGFLLLGSCFGCFGGFCAGWSGSRSSRGGKSGEIDVFVFDGGGLEEGLQVGGFDEEGLFGGEGAESYKGGRIGEEGGVDGDGDGGFVFKVGESERGGCSKTRGWNIIPKERVACLVSWSSPIQKADFKAAG
jgi:hypothetical protein